MFEIYIIVIVVAIIALLYRQTFKNWEYFKTIPGPPPLPIIGNALHFASTKQVLESLMKFKKQYGNIFKVQIGPVPKIITISGYDQLEFVLSSTRILTKSDDYNLFHPWLGMGLLTSKGAEWKKRRRVLTPAFHYQILESFIEIFEAQGKILVEKLAREVGNDSVDIYPYVTLCTLDIICETAMGTKIQAQSDDHSTYVLAVKEITKLVIERIISPIKMFDMLFPLTPSYYRHQKIVKILHDYTENVIDKRIGELETERTKSNSTKNNEDDNVGLKNKKAFLDLLLGATIDGKPLTRREIREEVDTFMFEGHDTTASGISFTLYCLATNPRVQKKAFAEQLLLFPNLVVEKSLRVTINDLQNMKYLEQVIKEALRLYPSVPFYARKTDTPLEFKGHVIPKDVTINIFAFGAQRDPVLFPDPETFNPERFDQIDGKMPYAYIPFSAGPRNCIGQKFAMLEMKSTISKILRNYELISAIPEHKLELVAESVLKSQNGVRIGINKRQNFGEKYR